MKNRSTFIMTLLALLLTQVAVAKGGVDLKVESTSNNTFVLALENPTHKEIRVVFQDLEGIALHEESYTRSELNLRYNLKNLPQGEYNLVVEYGDLVLMQPMTMGRGFLAIDGAERQFLSPPQIDQTLGYIDISMDIPTHLSAYLKIQDDSGKVIYGRRVKDKGQVQKRFNLEQLGDGNYQLSLALAGSGFLHRYTEQISLIANK